MTIFTDAFIPYEFKDKRKAYEYVVSRCAGIHKSLKLIELDDEHLVVKCPMSTEELDITGDTNDINWLHAELTRLQWYRS